MKTLYYQRGQIKMHGWCQTAMLKEGIVSVTRQLKTSLMSIFIVMAYIKISIGNIYIFRHCFNLCQLLINNIYNYYKSGSCLSLINLMIIPNTMRNGLQNVSE